MSENNSSTSDNTGSNARAPEKPHESTESTETTDVPPGGWFQVLLNKMAAKRAREASAQITGIKTQIPTKSEEPLRKKFAQDVSLSNPAKFPLGNQAAEPVKLYSWVNVNRNQPSISRSPSPDIPFISKDLKKMYVEKFRLYCQKEMIRRAFRENLNSDDASTKAYKSIMAFSRENFGFDNYTYKTEDVQKFLLRRSHYHFRNVRDFVPLYDILENYIHPVIVQDVLALCYRFGEPQPELIEQTEGDWLATVFLGSFQFTADNAVPEKSVMYYEVTPEVKKEFEKLDKELVIEKTRAVEVQRELNFITERIYAYTDRQNRFRSGEASDAELENAPRFERKLLEKYKNWTDPKEKHDDVQRFFANIMRLLRWQPSATNWQVAGVQQLVNHKNDVLKWDAAYLISLFNKDDNSHLSEWIAYAQNMFGV